MILSTSRTFRDLGVRAETAEALEAVGITHPFPIQEMTLPVAMAGNDIIGQAKTGTGKTLGFGIPILEHVQTPAESSSDGRPQALVVVPTRELCVQVTGDIEAAGRTRGVRVVSIYGGRAYEPQVAALKKGVEVVVGTPGRLLDLARQRRLDLSGIRMLVLDEADEMLDLGFLPDVETIVSLTGPDRQTMLFSATMPGQVINLARRYMRRPTHIRAAHPADEGATVAAVTQHVFRAHSLDKIEMLARLLQADGRRLAMVFCQTKRNAARVAENLAERGFAAAAVHGDLGQGAREQALRAFRTGKVDVLVATEVAARGIDVDGVTHVINYECPDDEKTYLHRTGRTGRAGASGIAVTFVDWEYLSRWSLINKALDLPFDNPPETYSTSEHFMTALCIPADATGVLPRAQRVRAGLNAEEVEDLGETGGRRTRRPAGHPEDTSPVRPGRRRNRSRSRTRSGEPVDAAQDGAETTATATASTAKKHATEAGADHETPIRHGEAADHSHGHPGPAPRRRRPRRRRRGSGAGTEAGAGTGSADAAGSAEAGAARSKAEPDSSDS